MTDSQKEEIAHEHNGNNRHELIVSFTGCKITGTFRVLEEKEIVVTTFDCGWALCWVPADHHWYAVKPSRVDEEKRLFKKRLEEAVAVIKKEAKEAGIIL